MLYKNIPSLLNFNKAMLYVTAQTQIQPRIKCYKQAENKLIATCLSFNDTIIWKIQFSDE